jgi:hypothetical protein
MQLLSQPEWHEKLEPPGSAKILSTHHWRGMLHRGSMSQVLPRALQAAVHVPTPVSG